MESQNKRTPLHAAAEGGHNEICHMLVQVRFLRIMCCCFFFCYLIRKSINIGICLKKQYCFTFYSLGWCKLGHM